MRRVITTVLTVLTVCLGSQAQASFQGNWTLDLSTLGGPTITNISGINMNGTVHLVQNVSGPGGTPIVGDTFTLSNVANSALPIVFTAASYVNSAFTQITPLLASGQGTLFLETPQLTGSISELLLGNMYSYVYNDPGSNLISLKYTNPSSVTTTLATFTMETPNSGGLSTDNYVGGSGQQFGTSNLYGFMTALLSGIFISDNGQDMMSIPLVLSSLSGGLNYNATNNGSQIEANIASDDNFSLAAVPEPASLLLLGSGALVMSFIKRRGRKSIAA